MGRFQDSSDEELDAAIDMSPLIDCVFILLIFFIVTTVFVEETGIDVTRPEAAGASNLEKNSILFAITPEGAVYYGGKNIGVQGVQTKVRQNLSGGEMMPVIIQADEASLSGIAIQVLGEAKLAGAEVVNFATRR